MQANDAEAKPIFPESEEAAKFVTGLSGWVDRNGHFWGSDERMARYSGSTHKHCDCGAAIEQRSYCEACSRRKDIDKHKNAQKIEWDHETPLYSQAHDKYLFDKDNLFDLMCETQVTDPDELELFICEPNELSQIDSEYWNDDLPEDGELPDSVEEALAVFNKALVDAGTVSWHPGKFAAIVDLEAKHD